MPWTALTGRFPLATPGPASRLQLAMVMPLAQGHLHGVVRNDHPPNRSVHVHPCCIDSILNTLAPLAPFFPCPSVV